MGKQIRPPFIQVDFQVNNICNAKCEFCKIWENKDYGSKPISAEKWIETAKKLKDFTEIEYVCIAGGEPFLYKDLFKLIKGLNKLDIKTTLVTNGSLVDKDICKKLLDSGIDNIDFSIDNFSDKHNKARGIPRLFENCIESIKTLKKLDSNQSVGITTLIYENNIRNIPEFVEWVLKELPVNKINFQAYNQVVKYEGKDWWKKDPLWPRDKEVVVQVLDYLVKKAKEEERISNHPLQFKKFKEYFLDPEKDMKIKCPAGTFNFSVSHKGEIIGCIAEQPLGNIKDGNPVGVYRNEFSRVRKKALKCKENCHFLINCYFPLHWKRWEEITKEMVEEEDDYKPGKLMIPPEIREIAKKGIKGYDDIVGYNSELDVIGRYDNINKRKLPHNYSNNVPTIFLCGENSEVHRWGVDLDENDFFKQIDKLDELSSQRKEHHVIVGVRRTNFFKLNRTVELIRRIRNKNSKLSFFSSFFNESKKNKTKMPGGKYDSDILLVNVPSAGSKHLPMSLGYIASYLKKHNMKVKAVDINAVLHSNTLRDLNWIWYIDNKRLWNDDNFIEIFFKLFKEELNRLVHDIVNSDIKLIGFSVVDSKEKITIQLIKRIKKSRPDIKIILGGPVARLPETRALFKEIYKDITAFVVGEGEKTTYDLIRKIKLGKDVSNVFGTINTKNGNEKINPPRKEIDAKEIVFPTYEEFDISYYNRPVPIAWSRGCINNCVFCVEREYWNKFRFRDPIDCYNELVHHIKSGKKEFIVYDSMINGDLIKLEKLLDLIIKNNLNIKWRANVVAWNNLNKRLFEKLKKAGCYELLFGIESGSDKILKSMRKGYNSEQASKILKVCHDSGIKTTVNFIVGFPGETEKDHQQTIKFIKKNKDYIDKVGGVATLQIVEGTYLARNRTKYKLDKRGEIGNLWEIANNTFGLRKKRAKEIISFLDKLGIEYERTNTLRDTPEQTRSNIKRLKKYLKNKQKNTEFLGLSEFLINFGLVFQKGKKDLPPFRIMPPNNIKKRFYQYLSEINKKGKTEGLEFKVVDDGLEDLLANIEKNAKKEKFDEKKFLRSLGPICKDVFIGPKGILLDIMGTCNVDCVYCRKQSPWNKDYWKDQHKDIFGKLGAVFIKNVLSEAKSMGTDIVYLVGGGEPTLHPQFSKLVDLITKSGMKFNLSTNGTVLGKYNKKLVGSTCKEITISMSYGSEKSWKETRPRSNVRLLHKIDTNVQELSNLKIEKKKKLPLIKALYVINKYNYKEILDMVKHAKEIGADSVWFQLVHLDDFSKDRLKMNEKEMMFVRGSLEKARTLCKKLNLEFHPYIDFEIKHYDKEKGDWSNKGLLHQGCYVGWRFMYVSLRREIFMCCGSRMTGLLDKSGKNLRKLWYGDIYKRYRNDGIIMHRENPLTLYGKPLYDEYCDSCDNHDFNVEMINNIKKYDLIRFVER